MTYAHLAPALLILAPLVAGQAGPGAGATAPAATAQHFARGVISTPEHGCIAFEPDGRTLYLTKRDPASKRSFIAVSRMVAGGWSEPVIVPFSGEHSDGDPAMQPDGSRLFFWSSRPLAQGAGTMAHLWVVDRVGLDWGKPQAVHAGGGPLFGMGPSVAADGSVYFLRGGPKAGGPPWLSRIRLSAGRYGVPEYLDDTVNAPYGGGDSAVAPDQGFIVFSSARPDSAGSGDLYVAVRRDGRWTEPRNLGPAVNSRENEYCPSLSPDGKYLYFTRAGEGILFVPRAAIGLE